MLTPCLPLESPCDQLIRESSWDLHFSLLRNKPVVGAVCLAFGRLATYFLGLPLRFIKTIYSTWETGRQPSFRRQKWVLSDVTRCVDLGGFCPSFGMNVLPTSFLLLGILFSRQFFCWLLRNSKRLDVLWVFFFFSLTVKKVVFPVSVVLCKLKEYLSFLHVLWVQFEQCI